MSKLSIEDRIRLCGIYSLDWQEVVEALSLSMRQQIIDEGNCCSLFEHQPRNTDGSDYTGKEDPSKNWQGLPEDIVCKICGDVVQEGYSGGKTMIDIHEKLREDLANKKSNKK